MDNSLNRTDLHSLTPQEVNIFVLQVVGKSDPVDYQDHRGLKGKDRDGLLLVFCTVREITTNTNTGPRIAVNWSTNQKAGCIRVSNM